MSDTYFSVEILTSSYIPHRWLFEDFIEDVLERSCFGGSNIYYLCVTKKERIKRDSITVNGDGDITLTVLVGESTEKNVTTNLRLLPVFRDVPEIDFGYFNVQGKVSECRTKVILLFHQDDEVKKMPVELVVLLDCADADLSNPPKIVYVGQSFSMLKRWRTHSQVNRASSLLSDEEELRLCYMHFKFGASFEEFGDVNYSSLIDVDDRESNVFKDRISLVEQALIKFYLPELNTQHVDGTLESKSYERLEDLTGVYRIILGLGVHGFAHQYWSLNQVLNAELITLEVIEGGVKIHEGVLVDHLNIDDEG